MRSRLTLSRLILREIQHAKLNTLLCLVCVVIATGLLVAMVSISRASVDATRKMMKDMGFNVLIAPPGTDPARYQALDFGGGDMPEAYVSKLTASTVLAQHFVGKYQKTITLDGCTVVLTGVLPELTRHGTIKTPMPTAYEVTQGEVDVGSAAARALDVKAGDTVTVLGKDFTVAELLPEKGAIPEDIRVYAHLRDVQALLGAEGRVNAIDALACQCPAAAKDIIAALENSIHAVLPNVQVRPYHSILLARHKQREIIYRLELIALSIVMAASASAIWGLTYQNVRNRRREIGVMRALGIPGWRIASLFVGKILGYSLSGAVLGCVAGVFFARAVEVGQSNVSAPPALFIAVLLATPVAAILFGLPPILGGLLQETADVLGENEG